LEKGDLPAARSALEKALEFAPKDPDIRNLLAVTLYMQGDVEGARRLLEEAVRLGPHESWHHRTLANVLAELGLPEEAAAEYRKSLELEPHGPEESTAALRTLVLAEPKTRSPLAIRRAIF